jgi:hypothetical protein
VEVIHLGQHFCKEKVSLSLIEKLNKLIDEDSSLIDMSGQLSGKIKKEYDVIKHLKQADTESELPNIVSRANDTYPKDGAFKWDVRFHSGWGNDQREGEYQIVHKHSGKSIIGYSTILFLKVPDFGPEFTETALPTNGRTVLLGKDGGSLSYKNWIINPKVGDFYVFPYDMEHIVYPFRGDGVRRSISMNFDLIYEKIDYNLIYKKDE